VTEDVEIESHRGRIGSISFNRSPQNLHVTRTASGFEMLLPIVMTFRTLAKNEPRLIVSDLHGKVFVRSKNGSSIGVGRLIGPKWESAGISNGESYDYPRETYIEWVGTLQDMAYVEQYREGEIPNLQMRLQGQWCYSLPLYDEIAEAQWNQMSENERARVNKYGRFNVFTEPQSVHSRTAYIEVSYPREVWIKMIRNLGVAENVLVEMPMPTSPSGDWDAVWNALVDARNAFEKGGTTGWQACVTSVRRALENWQQVEKEDQGPGWKAPSLSEREERTKRQRLDALRWHLMQLAHLGPHSAAEEWSRDDALLMLSTLSALLAERKP
jgi:hypothetical protein